MSSSNSEDGLHRSISSFGVFAILTGMIIGGILLAYLISCLKEILQKRLQLQIHNKSSGPNRPPSTTEKKREVEEEEKDLEAGTIMEKIEPHDNQQKDKRRSFRRPGILRWSQVKPERTSPRDLKDKISRPTRLLPTETSYVIVRSPLPARDHLPLTSNRSSRARSLDSQRLVNEIRKRRETDLSSGKTVAHPSSQTIVGLADSPASKAHTKRTVVWFDQISKNGSSIHSRHSRTTSLPSSWDEILHSPAADEPQEARLRLGSVSELWLDFQSQQLVGG
ncbi:hypothetical protein MJO28_013284 [Puccinia striiformis f. sp. tritici]|uniref:Uncharacterized protein n=1 Tax=Puccinia striiformis f. sp. tritici TaxID=168172 RepID=A0ACC0DXS9_9BASI|nr:hypothetical protein Pst134EB_024945 [Puccinia striiformis f. sp. tritici]KAI7940999.1 hypothetical protein MJO28_013284 [Puccinia striiformis f. sp. tritici]KAI7942964.1 hypothetical protein MJO29_012808 [Puccinia striiformis f. sp. tritici]